MRTFASTSLAATKVTLSAALAVVVVHVTEHAFGVKLNGSTAEFMGALTVVFHALLHVVGVNDPGEQPPASQSSPPTGSP